MINRFPPPKFGKVVDGKYVWNDSKPMPKYFKEGEEFIPIYLPEGQPGKFNFYMGDNEEKFNENLSKVPDDWHYRNKKITYTLNNLGYRGDDFFSHNWEESIVVFGCSCVFGVGVSEDETLTHYISEITGRNVINIGVPGGSNQFILDTSLIMKRKYGNPYSIIVMWTCTDRLPFYGDSRPYHIGIWNNTPNKNDVDAEKYKNIFDSFYIESSHENVTFYNIVQSMRNIWVDKTKYFEASFFEPTAHYGQLSDFFPFSNTARDLLHPGPTDHKKTASEIVEHCIKKYGKDYLQPGGMGLNTKLL